MSRTRPGAVDKLLIIVNLGRALIAAEKAAALETLKTLRKSSNKDQ